MSTSFGFEISGMPDFDQKRANLPNDGKMYCVPASSLNVLAYLDDQGYSVFFEDFEQILGANPSLYDLTTLRLWMLGAVMKTDPVDGTGLMDAVKGLQGWFKDCGANQLAVQGFRLSWGDEITIHILFDWLIFGALLVTSVGRYQQTENKYTRTSGHSVTPVYLGRRDDGRMHIVIRDSDRDENPDNLSAQAQFKSHSYSLQPQSGTFQLGDKDYSGTLLEVVGFSEKRICFIDGFRVIYPKSIILINNGDLKLLKFAVQRETGATTLNELTCQRASPESVIDIALMPGVPKALCVSADSRLWTVQLVDGRAEQFARAEDARRVAVGGRERSVYVLSGEHLVSRLSAAGTAINHLQCDVSIDDLACEGESESVLLMGSTGRVIVCDVTLRQVADVVLPPLREGGAWTIGCVGAGRVVCARQGGGAAVCLRIVQNGRVIVENVQHFAVGAVGRVGAGVYGMVVRSEGGRLVEYDQRWLRVSNSPVNGVQVDGPFAVPLMAHNADPITQGDPDLRDGWTRRIA